MKRYHLGNSKNRAAIGKEGEEKAAAYLIEQGYTVLGRNVRTPYGEIDLVVEKDNVTVFVEVKTRTSLSFGFPETSFTKAKQAHFSDAIRYYIQEKPDLQGEWRADVLAILTHRLGNQIEIVHFENVLME